jgi:hypothetical protein
MRRSDWVKYLIGAAVLFFCLTNVYRSTTRHDVTSQTPDQRHDNGQHSWLRFGSSASGYSGWDDFWLQVWHPYKDYIAKLRRIRIARAEDYREYNVTVNDVTYQVPLWQRRLNVEVSSRNATESKFEADVNGFEREYYFLAELLQVRIYDEDKARWSIKELKQWMHYLFLAGVEHIYLCDHFMHEHEKLDGHLKRYIDAGLVTYLPRGSVKEPMTAQTQCYQVG